VLCALWQLTLKNPSSHLLDRLNNLRCESYFLANDYRLPLHLVAVLQHRAARRPRQNVGVKSGCQNLRIDEGRTDRVVRDPVLGAGVVPVVRRAGGELRVENC
jgi:hypothetical protein